MWSEIRLVRSRPGKKRARSISNTARTPQDVSTRPAALRIGWPWCLKRFCGRRVEAAKTFPAVCCQQLWKCVVQSWMLFSSLLPANFSLWLHRHHAAANLGIRCAAPCSLSPNPIHSCHGRELQNLLWMQQPTASINRASGVPPLQPPMLTDPAVRRRKRKIQTQHLQSKPKLADSCTSGWAVERLPA